MTPLHSLAIPARAHTPGGAAFVTLGQGEPLVLVHGVGLRLEAWWPQLAAFSSSHRVIALDLPGHGGSGRLRATARLPDYVEWLHRALDEVGCGPANVVGHSMGALIALGHALAHPQTTLRVALLGAVHLRDAAAREAVLARARAIADGNRDPRGPLQRWFVTNPDSHERAVREQVRRWLSDVDQAGYATAYRAFAQGDDVYAHQLGELTCPALFLTGELDPNATPRMTRAMAGAAPRGEAVVIPGQRHMVALVNPDAVDEALRRWLRRPTGR